MKTQEWAGPTVNLGIQTPDLSCMSSTTGPAWLEDTSQTLHVGVSFEIHGAHSAI